MGVGGSAAERPGGKARERLAAYGGTVTFSLTVGAAATLAAAVASVLVDSVLAKRVLWVAVALAVAVTAGLWRAGTSSAATAPAPDPDRLPYGSRAGSRH
jgi:hypothetical protein